ncbi:hypothetical protein [Promicromonospora sp. NPDC023805]|uniref:hypothetical protein n=1 Tax=Promicromonospora sp. NPDC023805 TaxID=3154696 RepID=UPI0033FFF556
MKWQSKRGAGGVALLLTIAVFASPQTVMAAEPASTGDSAGVQDWVPLSAAEQVIEQNPANIGMEAAPDPKVTINADGSGFQGALDGGGTVSISKLVQAGTKTTNGASVTSENSGTAVDTVTQTNSGGARIVEVIHSQEASSRFLYLASVPAGTVLRKQDDGSILIGKEVPLDGSEICENEAAEVVPCTLPEDETGAPTSPTMEVTGIIGSAWAVDAAGTPVPAHYELGARNSITMVVEHSDEFQYPIVADPTYTRGGFKIAYYAGVAQVYMNKIRSGDFNNGYTAVCVGIVFVPVVGPALAAICGLAAVLNDAILRRGYCFKLTAFVASRNWRVAQYRGGFCR